MKTISKNYSLDKKEAELFVQEFKGKFGSVFLNLLPKIVISIYFVSIFLVFSFILILSKNITFSLTYATIVTVLMSLVLLPFWFYSRYMLKKEGEALYKIVELSQKGIEKKIEIDFVNNKSTIFSDENGFLGLAYFDYYKPFLTFQETDNFLLFRFSFQSSNSGSDGFSTQSNNYEHDTISLPKKIFSESELKNIKSKIRQVL